MLWSLNQRIYCCQPSDIPGIVKDDCTLMSIVTSWPWWLTTFYNSISSSNTDSEVKLCTMHLHFARISKMTITHSWISIMFMLLDFSRPRDATQLQKVSSLDIFTNLRFQPSTKKDNQNQSWPVIPSLQKILTVRNYPFKLILVQLLFSGYGKKDKVSK